MLRGALPNHYAFVPKGNVYITSNCRKLTQEKDRPVYTVTDANNRQIGIGVPTDVYLAVQFKEAETRADRAANVLKRDEGIARDFEREILSMFPQIRAGALRSVCHTALEKGKGKVGRTGKLDARSKVLLAVRAHIRHCETDYDRLLRRGVPREEARRQVEPRIEEVYRAWRGPPRSTRGKKAAKRPRSATRPVVKFLQAAKRAERDEPEKAAHDTEAARLTAADSIDAILKEAETAAPEANNLFSRHAMRSQRDQSVVENPVSSDTGATMQHTAPSSPSTPTIIRTAAFFRERRTPKPRITQASIQPSPPSAQPPKQTCSPTAAPLLSHEDRDQLRRWVARILLIEEKIAGRGRRRLNKLRRIEKLYVRINATLAGAAIAKIEHSAAARDDLVRRLRLAVCAVEGS